MSMRKPFSAIEQAVSQRASGAHNARQARNMQNPYPDAERAMRQGNGGNGMEEATGFDDIRDEIVRLIREGKLPADFDLESACKDEAFAELLAELPPEAAVRVYEAERRAAEAEESAMQRMTTQVRSRNALPKSTRGGAMSAPAVNYRDMDSASFNKMLADIKKTTRNGGKVRL